MTKFLLFFSLIFIYFCSQPGGDAERIIPETLRMVEKTAASDTTDEELGIDALPNETQAIKIDWHLPSDWRDIKKYVIYRSINPNGFAYLDEVAVESVFSQDTVYEDITTGLDTMYYYYVTSINEDGNESSPSDTAKYRLLEKANLSSPEVTIRVGSSINFKFSVINPASFNDFILRIEDYIWRKPVFVKYFISDFGNLQDAELLSSELEPFELGKSYYWRIDLSSNDPLSNGSESQYSIFTYQ